jgi:hypothetical protein
MAGHGEKLTRKQEQAVAALLTSRTVGQAARKVGISERTLRNWLADESFVRAFRAARKRILDHTIAQLQGASGRAVKTLIRNLSCGKPSAEIRAALGILDKGLVGAEIADLAAELEQIKASLKKDGKR